MHVPPAFIARYADRHGYGFHALNHTIDTLRVPHWTKIYAMLFLAIAAECDAFVCASFGCSCMFLSCRGLCHACFATGSG